MNDPQRFGNAIKSIARAYLFLHLNINLGTLNILPSWVGYIWIFGALPIIAEEEDAARLLRPLAVILGLWEGFLWVVQLFGLSYSPYLLTIIAEIIELYFHFQLLTNLASIAERYEYPERKKLLTLRTVRTLMVTALVLPFPWEQYTAVTIVVLIAHAIVAFWICAVLYSLRRSVLGENHGIIYCDTEDEQQ